jgi:hypothetical protein
MKKCYFLLMFARFSPGEKETPVSLCQQQCWAVAGTDAAPTSDNPATCQHSTSVQSSACSAFSTAPLSAPFSIHIEFDQIQHRQLSLLRTPVANLEW